MTDDIEHLKKQAELELERQEIAHRRELQKLRHGIEVQKALDEAPDTKEVGEDWACIYLGVEPGKLERLRADDGLPYKKYGGRTAECRYLMGELRRFRDNHIFVRQGAEEVKLSDAAPLNFSTLPALLEEHPFWIQQDTREHKVGIDRRVTTHKVVVGPVETVNEERFWELIQDPSSDIRRMSLDEAMKLPWVSQKVRQPFLTSYVDVLKQALEGVELRDAC